MTPDDIAGIFKGTIKHRQVENSSAVVDAYIVWLSANWKKLSTEDVSVLLSVGAAAYNAAANEARRREDRTD